MNTLKSTSPRNYVFQKQKKKKKKKGKRKKKKMYLYILRKGGRRWICWNLGINIFHHLHILRYGIKRMIRQDFSLSLFHIKLGEVQIWKYEHAQINEPKKLCFSKAKKEKKKKKKKKMYLYILRKGGRRWICWNLGSNIFYHLHILCYGIRRMICQDFSLNLFHIKLGEVQIWMVLSHVLTKKLEAFHIVITQLVSQIS